ncbi:MULTISPECIES: AbiH family protein [Liquorilactobacillus]
MVQVAYVIGNAFDLHLGLKTSYNDFINIRKRN